MSEADFTKAPPVAPDPLDVVEDEGFEAYVSGSTERHNPYVDRLRAFFWARGYGIARRYYGR